MYALKLKQCKFKIQTIRCYIQGVVEMRVHPALEPLFMHIVELRKAMGDHEGAKRVRRAYLKGTLQLQVCTRS